MHDFINKLIPIAKIMIVELDGVFSHVSDIRKVNDTLRFAECVVIMGKGTEHEQRVPACLKNELIETAQQLKSGQEIVVKCHLNGRESKGPTGTRYFVELRVFDLFAPTYRAKRAQKKS